MARAARALAGLMEEFEPDLVVSDILTLAPTLAAEVAGVPHATLIPHVYPVQAAGAADVLARVPAGADAAGAARRGGRRCRCSRSGCGRGATS